jgi:hypothetical protein
MTEEQVDMMIHGLMWMGIIKIKKSVTEVNMGAWGHLQGLIDK